MTAHACYAIIRTGQMGQVRVIKLFSTAYIKSYSYIDRSAPDNRSQYNPHLRFSMLYNQYSQMCTREGLLPYLFPPFFFVATILNELFSSFCVGGGPFLATSLHPPPPFPSFPCAVENVAPLGKGSTLPFSASPRRRTNSSAKCRLSIV